MTNNRAIFGLRSRDRGLIYEGSHPSFKDAVQDAVQINIDLTGLDLTGMDLKNINLDGINLAHANFANSDLTGANMSEAVFRECNFSGTSLFDACFCYSDLTGCDFSHAQFGSTDFSQASIIGCTFSGEQGLGLNYAQTHKWSGNLYLQGKETLAMSEIPLFLQGLKNTVAILDDKILIGGEVYDFNRKLLHLLSKRILASVENNFRNSTLY